MNRLLIIFLLGALYSLNSNASSHFFFSSKNTRASVIFLDGHDSFDDAYTLFKLLKTKAVNSDGQWVKSSAFVDNHMLLTCKMNSEASSLDQHSEQCIFNFVQLLGANIDWISRRFRFEAQGALAQTFNATFNTDSQGLFLFDDSSGQFHIESKPESLVIEFQD